MQSRRQGLPPRELIKIRLLLRIGGQSLAGPLNLEIPHPLEQRGHATKEQLMVIRSTIGAPRQALEAPQAELFAERFHLLRLEVGR